MKGHEGHEIIMVQEVPFGQGARFGPYCFTCGVGWVFFVVPTDEILEKAKAWVAQKRAEGAEWATTTEASS